MKNHEKNPKNIIESIANDLGRKLTEDQVQCVLDKWRTQGEKRKFPELILMEEEKLICIPIGLQKELRSLHRMLDRIRTKDVRGMLMLATWSLEDVVNRANERIEENGDHFTLTDCMEVVRSINDGEDANTGITNDLIDIELDKRIY